jgi:hypothetical protein
MWRVNPFLDNARNTHAANSIGTVFSMSAGGPLLCDTCTLHSNGPPADIENTVPILLAACVAGVVYKRVYTPHYYKGTC